jgi:hypothetical protein
VRWIDGTETWVPLKDLKEAYLVQVAEYACLNRIHAEPAFAAQIIAKVKTKYWQKTHKYDIEIPKSIAEAKRINAKNGKTLWWDSICQEMANARIAFEIYDGNGTPIGYQKIQCHIIFDVKLGENFRRKARLVAQGNWTEDPDVLTFSSVDTRKRCLHKNLKLLSLVLRYRHSKWIGIGNNWMDKGPKSTVAKEMAFQARTMRNIWILWDVLGGVFTSTITYV